MKSPIIYYGGKTSMIPHIIPIMPEHNAYTETFFGGGTLFFEKPMVKNETINDRLDIVVNFYCQIKTNYKTLKQMIDATLFSRHHHNKALLIIRNKESFNGVELAWAFWMLCNFSQLNKIGGGIKFSNEQYTSVPAMMMKMKNYFTDKLVERIENTNIENRDGAEVLRQRDTKETFHFIDPPYIGTDQGHYRGFTLEQLEKLLITCEGLKGKFILCHCQNDLIDRYAENNGWWKNEYRKEGDARSKNKAKKVEILVANYTPIHKMQFDFQ